MDGSFDAAMAILTVHHWHDQMGGLRELRRGAIGTQRAGRGAGNRRPRERQRGAKVIGRLAVGTRDQQVGHALALGARQPRGDERIRQRRAEPRTEVEAVR